MNNTTSTLMNDSPLRVLYIMGCGRSGSTLLDRILTNHPAIEGVGELMRLALPNRMNETYCSCGQSANTCSFWATVLQQWFAHPAVQDFAGYHRLQTQFEHLSSLPRLWKEQHSPSAAFRAYAEQTRALFAALHQASGVPLLVDSSKFPARALALSLIPGLDLQVIHLVRDGRGVAWSRKKRFIKDNQAGVGWHIQASPLWESANIWITANLASNWIRRHLGPERAMLCRYEDLVQQPAHVLSEIGHFIGLDVQQLIEKLTGSMPLDIGHTIGGNRMRMSKRIRLKPDMEWQQRLAPRERLLFYALAGWLLHQYGYQGSVSAVPAIITS